MKKIFALLLAVAMIAVLFAGCGNGTSGKEGDIPTITWYAVGNGMPSNYDAWTAEINEYLEAKIGVHLNYQCVSWGDWGNRRSVIVQTGEPFDIMFTDMGSYAIDVQMGAFADISDLIAQTPGLTDLIPADYLDACRIAGKLYAIPAYKDSSMTQFFVWTKADADAYFPDYHDYHELADITEGLKAIKEGTGKPPVLLNSDGIGCITGNRYDGMGIGLSGLGVSYFTGSTEVVPVFEQEDVMNQLRTLHEWFEAGLINSDAATLAEATGMCSMGVAQGWYSAKTGWGSGRGAEVEPVQFAQTVVSCDTVQGSMACISSSSKHPLEALKLLELVNTDNKVRDMLAYGQEGVNFEYVEEDGMQKIHKLNADWTFAAYTQGTFFDMSVEAGTPGNPFISEVKVQNENAISSPALGFYFDNTKVADKISACKTLFGEYKGLLQTGAGDPDVYVPEMMAKMRDAGFDEILAEVQAQFDAWLAANK